MELHRVKPATFIGDGRKRRALGNSHHLEAGGQARNAVAVAHPHRVAVALAPNAFKQPAVAGDLQLGAAELAMVPPLDAAAELGHHGLLAIANAEYR